MSKSLYNFTFNDVEHPICIVTLIHGAGEHSGRYDYLRDRLAEHRMVTVMGDLPGHGHSPGQRGHIDSFDEYVNAALTFLETARKRYGVDIPHVLFGHSMGGLIATLAVARTNAQPDLLILSSPAFGLRMKISPLRKWVGRALLPIAPRLTQQNGIRPEDVTRNRSIAKAYGTDHLVTHTVTLRWYFEFLSAMEKSFTECVHIHIPISIWQGGADRLVDPEVVRQFVQSCEAQSISYKEFPELYHEILNEPERDAVIAEIVTWIKAHLPQCNSL